jgi:spore coat protein CotH
VRAVDGAKNVSANSASMSLKTKQVTVAPPPSQLTSLFPQMYIRGTFNSFDTSLKMTLIADYMWQAKVKFFGQKDDRFKFDVHGDWRLNYGDDNGDFVADVGNAKSISVKNGAGEYIISFNEQTLAYTITPPGTMPPIEPPTPPVTSPIVKLDYATYTLQAGEIDYLHATTQSAGAAPKLMWTSSQPDIVNVNEETIKAIAPGTATVTVALADNPTIFDTCIVTVTDNTRHPVYNNADLNYVFDMTALPEITIEITTEEWNKLLQNYDTNPQNEIEVMADFAFDKNGTVEQLPQIGIRLRGNTSRRRPEGTEGQVHNAFNPQWNHAHFALKFSKFNKSQKFHGMSDLNTKWFKDDALYAREVFSYDLQRRSNVWTAPFSSYAKLSIKIKEDNKVAYFGVYQMVEAINQDYLNKRFPKNIAGTAAGNLWKGTYPGSTGPADLVPRNLEDKIGIEDPDNDIFKSYDLKTNKKTIDTIARPELEQFMEELSSSAADKQWLEQRVDVDLFLRYLAASVAVGSWDDYWVLGNNYYMYFDMNGKMHWIPYDFDNTLGTSSVIKDAGKQDVLRWGPVNSSRPLVYKMLLVPEFKAKYVQYLNELLETDKNLFDERKSIARIKAWQKLVGAHVKNDTGEDMVIADKPASWGNASYYRLLSGDVYSNFFKAKAEAIRKAKP